MRDKSLNIIPTDFSAGFPAAIAEEAVESAITARDRRRDGHGIGRDDVVAGVELQARRDDQGPVVAGAVAFMSNADRPIRIPECLHCAVIDGPVEARS